MGGPMGSAYHMKRLARTIFFCLMGAALTLFTSATGAAQSGVPVNRCQTCHDGYLHRVQFPQSVHGNHGCISCHTEIVHLGRHMTGEEKPVLASCGSCHGEIASQYRRNFHYIQEDFRCYDCHRDIHAIKPVDRTHFKRSSIEKCTACHSNEAYVASGHSEALLKGNEDSAACSDCHGLHDTQVYHTSFEKYPAEAREFYTDKCKRCHADEAMMKRNNLSSDLVRYYEETYHGKVQNIGYPSRVAGCADCHTTHNILPKSDPRSSIHPQNLVENCGRCHSGFHARFVDYKAHPNYRDRKNYPSLFWTFVLMSGLLVFTFLFFWIHTFLWWRKTYWESHRMEKLGIKPECTLTPEERLQHVQRFSPKERIMHVFLVLSFFTLVMTGFPIKYPEAAWSGLLIDLWGGAYMAGPLPSRRRHRINRHRHLRGMAFVPIPLPQRTGCQGMDRPASGARLSVSEPEGLGGYEGHDPMVFRPGRDAEVRPVDLLGKI